MGNRVFLGPMLGSGYPPDLLADTAAITDWSFVQDGDEASIAAVDSGGIDLLGVNYYTPSVVRQWDRRSERLTANGHGQSEHSPFVGCTDIEFVPQPGQHTEMGWAVDPTGLSELLLRLHRDHPGAAGHGHGERRRVRRRDRTERSSATTKPASTICTVTSRPWPRP